MSFSYDRNGYNSRDRVRCECRDARGNRSAITALRDRDRNKLLWRGKEGRVEVENKARRSSCIKDGETCTQCKTLPGNLDQVDLDKRHFFLYY